jgi:hypothetical protein
MELRRHFQSSVLPISSSAKLGYGMRCLRDPTLGQFLLPQEYRPRAERMRSAPPTFRHPALSQAVAVCIANVQRVETTASAPHRVLARSDTRSRHLQCGAKFISRARPIGSDNKHSRNQFGALNVRSAFEGHASSMKNFTPAWHGRQPRRAREGLAASCCERFHLIGHCPRSSSASRFTAGVCGFSNQARAGTISGILALRNDALQPELARVMEDYNKIGTNTKCR